MPATHYPLPTTSSTYPYLSSTKIEQYLGRDLLLVLGKVR